ncbi:uncharacterized protein LOC105698228 [Orussus abietinus]|uniref:uncharacterized protein LOC105698228 n=1 Tax=Orussus abietinus TaxID=222816 RepID=UPI000C715B14|nr:uncharacterized protein LOC105698228 [Orussus abietinus]
MICSHERNVKLYLWSFQRFLLLSKTFKGINWRTLKSQLRRMGNQNSKRPESGDDIISEKSLQAVKESINFLKQHAREEGLFRRAGRRELRKQILTALKKGENPNLENLDEAALECAAALQLFVSRLKKPVMPQHVQELILADNPGVEAHIVARDALGLIRQDVSGRHGELLADLLGLLRHLTLTAPPSECSELRGSPLPVALLPVFFTLTPADLVKWRQVAARFSELITEAPTQLRVNASPSTDDQVMRDFIELEENGAEESEQLARLRELSLFYPLIRLTNPRNARQVGEMARVLAAPLRRPPPSRLHPVISRTIR